MYKLIFSTEAFHPLPGAWNRTWGHSPLSAASNRLIDEAEEAVRNGLPQPESQLSPTPRLTGLGLGAPSVWGSETAIMRLTCGFAAGDGDEPARTWMPGKRASAFDSLALEAKCPDRVRSRSAQDLSTSDSDLKTSRNRGGETGSATSGGRPGAYRRLLQTCRSTA